MVESKKPDLTEERVAEVLKKRRIQRSFPASSFEEPLEFAQAIYQFGAGQSVRRLTLFDHLGKSPESGLSRQMITNANKYQLVKGGYQAESLELTPEGTKAVDEQAPLREQARCRIKLAILDIEPFARLYEKFVGNKLPQNAALIDAAKDAGVPAEHASEAVDIFIVNLRFVGLLKTLSGAERIVTVDTHLDGLPSSARVGTVERPSTIAASSSTVGTGVITSDHAHFESTCFYIAPIGEPESEQRKHSDLFLGSFVEPALEQFKLTVIRADAIDKPGIITRQILEYIVKSRLVIADLSFHNPNVFYELAIRHAMKLPVVQIIRASEKVPFDMNQMRTIPIDTSDIYALVPKIDSYRAEIANQVRRALDPDGVIDTPISTYFPSMRVTLS